MYAGRLTMWTTQKPFCTRSLRLGLQSLRISSLLAEHDVAVGVHLQMQLLGLYWNRGRT